jgi:hypothetical protein
VRKGAPAALREAPSEVLIERSKSRYSDILDWCREVVWWGNKKGAYLYGNEPVGPAKQLAGHY